MMAKIIMAIAAVALFMATLHFAPTGTQAQTAPPGIPGIHQQVIGCNPCEVWLDAGMAVNGLSGVIAVLPESSEEDPPDPFFKFGGMHPADLVHISRDVSWRVVRADLGDVIMPTPNPVMLFTYKGPYRPVKSIRIDDDNGDLIIEFDLPMEVVLPGA